MNRLLVALLGLSLFALRSEAQTIYQLTPISTFGTHGDGSIRPGEIVFDSAYNQRGMAYDSTKTNLVIVDTHTGQGASDHPVGHIWTLDGLTGNHVDDGFGGNFEFSQTGIPTVSPNQAYPYAPAVVADDGVVYVCNQVNNSANTPFIIYRYASSIDTNPPFICFSNTITPQQRYGTSIAIRGAGPNTQILIGSLASSSTGTNVVIFTTTNGTNFTANILGADVSNPNFNDGVAFGAGNTFWGKQVASTLRCFAFNLAAHTATSIATFSATTFPDNPNLGTIAVNTNLNLMAAVEEAGGGVSGGPERVRLYDISNFSNQPPSLLDVKTFPVDNPNATAPMAYMNFVGSSLYVHVVNNGMMAFNVSLGTPPAPSLTAVPPATNIVVPGRTISLTVAGFPSVAYQWQSNSVNIPGATNGTLTLVNVQNSYNQALFTCVVTNAGGSTNVSSRVVIANPANFYHLNLQWVAFPGDDHNSDTHSYIQNGNGAAPGTPNQRSIAYNALSNHLYVISRSGFANDPVYSNYTFNVVDASTGDLLYQMRTNDLAPGTNGIVLGVGNGGVGLSTAAVADDGAIYVCNVATAAGGYIGGVYDDTRIFRVYRWADGNSNTPPVQIFTGDPAIAAGIAGSTSTNRWGDSLAVRGSGTNTQLILDNNNANVRYIAILTPTDTTMTNWTVNGLHQSITGTTIGRSLEFEPGGTTRAGNFWQKRNATALLRSAFDLDNPIDPVPTNAASTAFTNALSGATIDPNRHILMGVATYNNALVTPDTLDLYEISDLTSPLLLSQYPFPVNFGTNHNGNSANCINQTIRSGDKVFTLDTGNGLMAFNIAAGAPTAPNFLAQPQNVRVMQGGTASFTVSVDVQAAFQWRFNGANISGATAQTYVLSNAQLTDAGSYSVVASNTFGLSTSAVATATVVLPSQEYSLSQVWRVPPTNASGAMIRADGAGTPNARTIAYNALSNHLYLVSRFPANNSSNYAVYILDASSGALLGALNTNGLYKAGAVGEGGVGLGGIGVADDGAIYACNVALDACGCSQNALTNTPADSIFRLYRWSSEDTNSGPALVFTGDPAGRGTPTRWGDAISVRGSGTNTEIIVDSHSPIGFAAVLKPTDQFMTNFASQSLTDPAAGSTIGRSLQFGPTNTFWQKRSAAPLQYFSFNVTGHSSSLLANYGNFSSTIGPVALDLSRKLMAAINFRGSNSAPDSTDLFDISNPNTPLQIASYNFPTNQQGNANFIGQAVFAGNRVWALDGNNGLLAFNLVGPQLNISRVANATVISWSTNVTGMTLQSTTDLATQNWIGLGTGSIIGPNYYVTNTSSSATLLYRLKN